MAKTTTKARASTKPSIPPTFTAIAKLLEKVKRSTFHRRVTGTSYEIRHDISDDLDGDYTYMVPFARLEAKRGTKLTFYPLRSFKKLRAKVTRALAAHALADRKSFVFKEDLTAGALKDLAALIELGAKIWYIEVSD